MLPTPTSHSPDAPGAFVLLQDAVRMVVNDLGGEVAFGGLVGPTGEVPLLATLGVDATRFAALRPEPGRGLGGRVLDEPQPHAVADYGAATSITHEFATPIREEGLRGVGCVPVRVGGRPRGLLYVASRARGGPPDRLLDAVDRLALVVGTRIEERARTAERVVLLRAELARQRARLSRARRSDGTSRGSSLLALSRALVSELDSALDDVASLDVRATAVADVVAPVQAPALTPREREVLALLRGGASNRTIASRLVISEATVKAHIGRMKVKLGAESRLQLVVNAAERGIA